ncbi:MAG: preprotein translocase subunit YajC [Rhodospirillales bacterium]|nr:preprotein translocase subunit YajC [Alphaproteobacteria bacterium]MCB9986014.1 preprotein translocase subunit YajC [Rhodospirillales bacterium]USO07411.1 MAG: preprotein translocase subunit YajC [Rhodospirillales bacterium]
MLITQAFAQDAAPATVAPASAAADAAATPGMGDTFLTNMGLIALMFVLFYVLLIRPQQKRMKQQQTMLGALKVGDRVVTGGGLVGNISRLVSDAEVEVDLGGTKVTALRYTLSVRGSETVPDAPAK